MPQSQERLELPPGTLLYRRLHPGAWAAQQNRPFGNSFELRPGESGASVYIASRCDERDVMAGHDGFGLAVIVYEEIVPCFDVFPSEEDPNPKLRGAHVELRPRGVAGMPERKSRRLAKAAGIGLLIAPQPRP